jgi:hypothetical protein
LDDGHIQPLAADLPDEGIQFAWFRQEPTLIEGRFQVVDIDVATSPIDRNLLFPYMRV